MVSLPGLERILWHSIQSINYLLAIMKIDKKISDNILELSKLWIRIIFRN